MSSQEEPRLIAVLSDGREVFDFGNGRIGPVFAGGADDDDDSKDDDKSDDKTDDSKDDDSKDDDSSKDDDKSDDDSKDDKSDKEEKELVRARREAAKYRTERNKEREEKKALTDQIAEIKKKLGLTDDDKDEAALEKKLQSKEQELKDLKVEKAIAKAAKKHGADADALTDSRAFMKEASGLDPADDDFADDIDSLVDKAVKDNPKLKVGQAPSKGGAEHGGGSSGKRFTRKEIEAMSPAEREKNLDAIVKQLESGPIT